MNLTGWAAAQGIRKTTAYRWYRDGVLPVSARKSGRLILVAAGPQPGAGPARAGLYARVSSHDQKAGLDRQAARLAAWAAANGLLVVKVVTEAGSGMNGARPKARRLPAGPDIGVIVAGHRGRLGRCSTELAGAALAAAGRRVAVTGGTELDDDLVRDMTEVLTSFCARLYGRRPARNRAQKALACAARDPGGSI